jgi:hypothetical protein
MVLEIVQFCSYLPVLSKFFYNDLFSFSSQKVFTLFSFLGGEEESGIRTQGFALAKEALYYFSHTSSPESF